MTDRDFVNVLLWVVLVQAVVIFLYSLTVLPLWWCYMSAQAALRAVEKHTAELNAKIEVLDEVLTRVCETAGVPTAGEKK